MKSRDRFFPPPLFYFPAVAQPGALVAVLSSVITIDIPSHRVSCPEAEIGNRRGVPPQWRDAILFGGK